MKLKKLLKRISVFLSSHERKRSDYISSLEKLLKALRRKKRKLRQAAVEASSAKERQAIKNKLKVIHRQRVKGVEALRAARKAARE